MIEWKVWFDGAYPNGLPCCGFVIRGKGDDGTEVEVKHGQKVELLTSDQTMNVGEYGGLVAALGMISGMVKVGDRVEIRGDSQLVIRQMNGQYRIKKPHLAVYANKAKDLISLMKSKGIFVTLIWVPREENTEADAMSKEHAS